VVLNGGCEEPKQGVRNTKCFRGTRPENLKQIFLNMHRNSLEYDAPLSTAY